MTEKETIRQAWENFKIIRNEAMGSTFKGLRRELEIKQYCVSPVFANENNKNYFKVTIDGLYLDIIEDEAGDCNISQDIYLEIDDKEVFKWLNEEQFKRLAK